MARFALKRAFVAAGVAYPAYVRKIQGLSRSAGMANNRRLSGFPHTKTVKGVPVEIRKVGVIGCGTMGSGICEVCSRAGFEVVFTEVTNEAVAAGTERISRSVERAVDRGKMERGDADALLARISGSSSNADLAGCDLVFEAVPEHLDLKKKVFGELDHILSPEAILATNTSSLPVIDMAVSTERPDRVIGFHFFNPAQVMKFVELVRTVATDDSVVDSARQFAEALGKAPVVARDRAGFIANLLLFPYLNAATRMYDEGYASREDIDAAMTLGCGHPMGPLGLLDLIGLDSAYEICEALWRQFRDDQDAPNPLLKQYVTAGYLGRKTGRGFYRYEAPESPKITDAAPVDASDEASDVRTVAVVGTGLMASGIAEVAARAGNPKAVRAAGNGLGSNPMPVVVPCHRVVRSGHGLGGYTGGLERKEFLLGLEGSLPEGH